MLVFIADPVRATERFHRRHGPTIAFRFRERRRTVLRSVLLHHPSHNREVLTATDHARPSGLWSVSGPPDSVQTEIRKKNYIVCSGAEHVKLVKTTTPHLTKQRVALHFDAIKTLAAEDVARWPLGETVDLYALVRDMGQRIAFGLLFGEGDLDKVRGFGKLLADYHAANWKLAPFLVPFTGDGSPRQRVYEKASRLRDFVAPWVGERGGCPVDADLRAAYAAYVSTEGEKLSPARLAAHFNFLGFASYETMSSALTWTLFLLALHPQVLADLDDELAAAPGLDTISEDELGRLPLLDGVVKESLRLVPPTPVLPWRTFRAWSVAGLDLEEGRQVVLSPHLTHRMPEIYAEPDRFLPERWQTIRPTPYEYLPFSGGPRRCPGAHFGTEFMKVALAAFVPKLRLEIRPGTRIDRVFRGITQPKSGIPVRLVPRRRDVTAPEVRGSIRDMVALPA